MTAAVAVRMTETIPAACAICGEAERDYAFTIAGRKFHRCKGCRTIAPDGVASQPAATALPYDEAEQDPLRLRDAIIHTLAERKASGPYLILAEKDQAVAHALSYGLKDVITVQAPDQLKAEQRFGAVLLLTPLTYQADMQATLRTLSRHLVPDGMLLLLQPMHDSTQAALLGRNWHEWQKPHHCYVTRDTLHLALIAGGFERVWFRRARHAYHLDYLQQRAAEAHTGMLARIVSNVCSWMPGFMRKKRFALPSGKVIVTAQPVVAKTQEVLSIIVPVYNEKNTFVDMMEALLAKKVPDLRKEIILIESNSTDGTRALVQRYETHPDVRVIYQEKPRGKGFAVREGLAAATGDYVLIQDADLEYDLNDYDGLLEPLRQNKAMFVLGSRHRGHWKMREFNDAPVTAAVFNIGHVFFTEFLNLLLWQQMTDPFTMFKVMRRDALFGLDFICRRFDFDHEMVIKLVRKGYKPLELPVNYTARSFAEGKKVSFVKDGLTWVTTDLRLRFGRLGFFQH